MVVGPGGPGMWWVEAGKVRCGYSGCGLKW